MMSARNLFLIALLLIALGVSPAQAQVAGVSGTVVNATGQPIPGVVVSLFHPVIGRSASSITDRSGRYSIFGVPIRADSYYIEAHWGNHIIYRAPVRIQGPITWNIQVR
jgi:hypothetical protein